MVNYLKEDFTVIGTDAQEFFDLCKDMDKHTVYLTVKGPVLGSFTSENEENGELTYNGATLSFNVLEKTLNDANEAEALYNEMKLSRAPVIAVEKTRLLATNKAIAEIAALRGLHGSPISVASRNRDNYVTELASGLKVTFVGRKEGELIRVLSTRSAKYGSIPMETIQTAYDAFMSSDWIGSYEVKSWRMTQDDGAIYIEFPELANNMKVAYPAMPDKWVPGVVFENGTTGYCTLNAKMTYRREGSYDVYVIGRIAAKHFAGFTPDAFIQKMQNETWGLYTKMPEALEKASLVSVDTADIELILEKLWKFVKLNKVFQKKDTETCKYLEKIREKALNTAKIANASTLYDLINIVMDIPSDVDVPEAYKELLKETCGRAWQYEA